MNNDAALFRPDDIVVELGGQKFRLYYDLNAFCELEKIYTSVDNILQMILGTNAAPDLEQVTYKGNKVDPLDVAIAGTPLTVYINKLNNVKEARHSDTLTLLWAGCLHDHAIFEHEEIVGYTITKSKLGSLVTLRNLGEVNAKIVAALLRDLIPADAVKNAEAPEQPVEEPQATRPRLVPKN